MEYTGRGSINEILEIVKTVHPHSYVSLNKEDRAIIDFNLPQEKMRDPHFKSSGWVFLNLGCNIYEENGKIVVEDP